MDVVVRSVESAGLAWIQLQTFRLSDGESAD